MNAPAFKKPFEREAGFTMIETVIALVIMMIVGLAAAGGFAFAVRYNTTAANRAACITIAQTSLEKLRAVPFTDSSLTAGTTTVTVSDSAGRTYTLTTTTSDTVVSGKTTMKQIAVSVAPVMGGILNATTNGYYGSTLLLTKRSNPLVGANIH
ncbi:MAG: hypothetical protein QOK48_3291 [Blastocatellia bacterium]|nr:hypothetical protein [Blastocatellia bacterium]